MFSRYRPWRGVLLVTLSSGLLLLPGRPGRAQQPAPSAPSARHSAPATAAVGRPTNVPVQFDLPQGHSLIGFPRLRVLTTRGRIQELKPVYITARPPAGRGLRALATNLYKPGAYLVRLECTYKDAAGKTGTVVSPFTTLTVPAR